MLALGKELLLISLYMCIVTIKGILLYSKTAPVAFSGLDEDAFPATTRGRWFMKRKFMKTLKKVTKIFEEIKTIEQL